MITPQHPIERQLAYAYAQLIDDRRLDELAAIFAPDCRMSGPGYQFDSFAAFRQGLELIRKYDRTFHLVANQIGAWHGDVYEGETYCVASHIYTKDDREMKMDMGIRYRDRIALHDGTYKFTARHLDVVWVQDLPLQMTTVDNPTNLKQMRTTEK
jgi:SnoaL-like domain